MSITLNRNSNRIEGSGFVHGMNRISVFESPDIGTPMIGNLVGEEDKGFSVSKLGLKGMKKKVEEREKDDDDDGEEEEEVLGSSSSSSSIGRNSDLSNGGSLDEDGSDEVQSSYKGSFDNMDSLEEVLPIKRGISRFYCGKSKSYTSLADASSSSSVTDIVKPENVYSKKRRNLLACSIILDKNRSSYPFRNNGGGGISKRMTSSRSTLAFVVAMNNSETESGNNSDYSNSPPTQTRPPLHPQLKNSLANHNGASLSSPPQKNLSSWRSFSLADLQFAATNNMTTSNLSISVEDQHEKLH